MKGQATPSGMWLPGTRKDEGGSYFDDELAPADKAFADDAVSLVKHLNERPDHTVFVASLEDRDRMRKVFNHFKTIGAIGHHPSIKIDYGVPEGGIRIAEDRT